VIDLILDLQEGISSYKEKTPALLRKHPTLQNIDFFLFFPFYEPFFLT
jgi:hypothetical protein